MPTVSSSNATQGFTIQHQQKMMWCWSAVGTSCALFYDSASGWSQCKMAAASIDPAPGDCCGPTDNSACDVTWYLVSPDQTQGSLVTAKIANGFVSGAISFDRLKSELDAGRLVAFRLKLKFQGQAMYHFVVVQGYHESGTSQEVMICDPYFGNSEMQYDDFTTDYKFDGEVTHTFFTVPNQSS